jgi:hypothetical protein
MSIMVLKKGHHRFRSNPRRSSIPTPLLGVDAPRRALGTSCTVYDCLKAIRLLLKQYCRRKPRGARCMAGLYGIIGIFFKLPLAPCLPRGIRCKRTFHRGALRLVPLLIFLLVPLTFSLVPGDSAALAADITLAWDANDEPDVEGYVVYRNTGSSGPPYSYSDDLPENELANPLRPAVTMTGLRENIKYYLSVTAYDTEGNESDFSDELCVQIIDNSIGSCSAATNPAPAPGSASTGSSGGGGSACFIATAAGAKASASINSALNGTGSFQMPGFPLFLSLLSIGIFACFKKQQ